MHKIKQLIKWLISHESLLRYSKGNRFIFVFHDVSNPNSLQYSKKYSTPIDRFKEQLSVLNNIFEILPLEQIVGDKNLKKGINYAAITFDDGFYSVVDKAHPLLTQLNIPYAVFLNGAGLVKNQNWICNLELLKGDTKYAQKLLNLTETDCKEEDTTTAIISRGKFEVEFIKNYKVPTPDTQTFMNIGDATKLANEGVAIGNHSYDHIVFSSSTTEVLDGQIKANADLLSDIKHDTIEHFALPFGKKDHFTPTNIAQLKKAGYKYIYTTNPNRFRAQDLKNDNFLIPRIGLTDETPQQLMFYINRSLLKHYDL